MSGGQQTEHTTFVMKTEYMFEDIYSADPVINPVIMCGAQIIKSTSASKPEEERHQKLCIHWQKYQELSAWTCCGQSSTAPFMQSKRLSPSLPTKIIQILIHLDLQINPYVNKLSNHTNNAM